MTYCRESLNSSGTVSRKTSTTSEYTPEHTMVNNTRPVYINDTNVSYVTDTCVTAAETAAPANAQPKDTEIIVVKDVVRRDYEREDELGEKEAKSESAIGEGVDMAGTKLVQGADSSVKLKPKGQRVSLVLNDFALNEISCDKLHRVECKLVN